MQNIFSLQIVYPNAQQGKKGPQVQFWSTYTMNVRTSLYNNNARMNLKREAQEL